MTRTQYKKLESDFKESLAIYESAKKEMLAKCDAFLNAYVGALSGKKLIFDEENILSASDQVKEIDTALGIILIGNTEPEKSKATEIDEKYF